MKKLSENSAIITQSDKGNSVVIIKLAEYNQKIIDYISSNKLKQIDSDPTNKFQSKIKNVIKESNNLIQKPQKRKYTILTRLYLPLEA
jgi:hypothetical protein